MQRSFLAPSIRLSNRHCFSLVVSVLETDTIPDIVDDADIESVHEPRYRILIHNDDVTPFLFVMVVLRRIFKLSREIAEHVTLTAHIKGVALVMVRPKAEAENLVKKAHMAARLEGFPLTFSIESEE